MAAEIQKATGVKPELKKTGGGVFEVTVNGMLIYSKKKERRFPRKGEVLELMRVENFPKDEEEKKAEE